jgi:hypothetical protein
VFAVYREELGAAFVRGGDDEGSGGDEGFFVGEGDVAAEVDGSERGGEAGRADHRAENNVALNLADEAFGGVLAASDAGAGRWMRAAVGIRDGEFGNAQSRGLGAHGRGVAASREAHDSEAHRRLATIGEGVEMIHDLDGLGADGAGGAEDDEALFDHAGRSMCGH